MIVGAIILLVGIGIGYSIPFWISPFVKVSGRIIKKVINRKASIVDTSPEVDLGE